MFSYGIACVTYVTVVNKQMLKDMYISPQLYNQSAKPDPILYK